MNRHSLWMPLVISLVASPVCHAAFSKVAVSTITAQANLTTRGFASMSASLRTRGTNAAATEITWSNVTLPTAWKMADQYILLASTLTDAGSGIEIYTDNKGTEGPVNPLYRAAGNPAGLVDTTFFQYQNGTYKQTTLPLAWSIKASTITTPPTAAFPGGANVAGLQWLWMQDLNTTADSYLNRHAFYHGDPYSTVRNIYGIHYGGSVNEFGEEPSPNAVYLETDFTNAISPRTYKTSSLRIVVFIQ